MTMGRHDLRWRIRAGTALVVLLGASGLQAMVSIPDASATPDTLYVATNGHDSGTCQSKTSPCKTITYAFSQAASGDTIDIGPGTFTAAISLFEAGTFTFQGSDANDPSSGTIVEPTTSGGTPFEADRSGFTLDDLTVNGLGGDAIGSGYGSTVNINDSTITNSAEAIANDGPASDTTVMDTTISGNSVGIDTDDPSAGLNLTEDTVAGNTDGIEGALNSLSVAGTIVADNSGGDCTDNTGSLDDNGYNDNGDGTCGFTPTENSFPDTNPDLGTLEDNGGPTDTQEPAPTGPVIGQIPVGTMGNSVSLCPGLDQRGVARPQGAACDMGAVEDNAPQVSGVFPPTGLTTVHTSVTITGAGFTGTTAVDFGGVAATGVTVTSDSSLTASSPFGTAGTVNVTVTGPTGTSGINPADDFTYTVDQTPTVVGCSPSCTDTVSSPDPTTVSATGSSGELSPANMSLVVNTGTLSCGAKYDYLAPISTLSTTGFAAGENVTVTDTVSGVPSTNGFKICFEANGSLTNSFLGSCSHNPSPCVESLVESSGSVVATFLSPASDPRFWGGGATVVLKKFSPTEASPGTVVMVKGKNLDQVASAVIGGVQAEIRTVSNSKLDVTVPASAVTGSLTLVSASGDAVSKVPFVVTPPNG
jgi:IPT/TIG domain